jgi:hypothetical protein
MPKIFLKFEREDGQELTAGTGIENIKIMDITGLTASNIDIIPNTSPQIVGALSSTVIAGAREITVNIRAPRGYREQAISFFNTYINGRIYITWDDITRYIDYIPYPVEVAQKTVFSDTFLTIRLMCPDFYFMSVDDYGKNIASVIPLQSFPFAVSDIGSVVGVMENLGDVAITNNGATPTPCKFIITAKNEVTNPKVTINQNQYMQANLKINEGDKLVFDTNPRQISMTLNGVNILDSMDIGSTFFQVPIGGSSLGFDADFGTNFMDVFVFFTPMYLGI